MAMAQGYTKDEVNSILEDVEGSKLIISIFCGHGAVGNIEFVSA